MATIGAAVDPLNITWQAPLNYNSTTRAASIDLSGYVSTISFSTFSTSTLLSISNLSNKTNFSKLLVSGVSTFLSSLNVSGTTTLEGGTKLGSLLYKPCISPNFEILS